MNAPRHPLAFLILLLAAVSPILVDPPRSSDPNVKIELVAESPEIVTPVGCTVDKQGRLLVIESHTHFRPKDYVGPPADRIRIISDFDEHGRARKFTTFWEGSRATMNLAAAPDGSILVAARNEILRLRDTKGTGVADEKTVLARLDTKSEYPHNGLDSITLGRDGNIYFGIGENLGLPWKLIAADGTTIQDDGSNAGQIYVMDSSGGKLRRFATGFWNPFGLTFDNFDRLIATDNDPDGRPPCRLVYVVPGGDYGYQYRYGRSGHHPLQGWEGELPGTLPPICGTGEAPCMVLQYRGKNLPAEYVNKFFVASWGDHRIEIYTLTERGAGFTATMKSLITGGDDFRPVGLAVAPDGSIFITDWVDKSYQLHGKGRIWRISSMTPQDAVTEPTKPGEAMVRAQAIRTRYLCGSCLEAFKSDDVFIRQAGVCEFSRLLPPDLENDDWTPFDSRQRLGWLAAMRLNGDKKYDAQLAKALQDPDPDIRFFATRWIADDRLTDYRAAIEKAMTEPVMTQRLFAAYLAALERLDGKGAFLGMPGTTMDQYLLRRIVDEKSPLTVRTMAMQMLPSQNQQLKLDVVRAMLKEPSEPLRTACVRWLAASPDAERLKLLAEIADDNTYSAALRADAVAGLGSDPKMHEQFLRRLQQDKDPVLNAEAARALRFLTTKSFAPPIPRFAPTDTAAWMKFTGGPGDPESGRRIFFNRAVAACAVCHTVDNRGSSIGPDLTMIGHSATRESLLKSILEPSAEIAPRYTLWSITTRDGKTVTGMLTGHVPHNKTSDDEIYADAAGHETAIPSVNILTRTPLPTSLMPPNQLDTLTAEEIRDLLAFLLVKR